MHEPPDLPVAQIRKRLAYLISRSELSQGELEQTLGLGKGHLSYILGGGVDLKHWHVEALLDGLGIDPGEFFVELFPPPRHWPWGLDPEHEAELSAQGKLFPLLLVTLFGFGIEALEGEHRRLERLEDWLGDLARKLGEDVTS